MNPRFALILLIFGSIACKEVPPPIDPTPPEPTGSPYEFILQGPIDSFRITSGIPGLAVGIVEGEQLTYEGYFGLQSVDGEEPIDRESRFTAGPLSGMVTAMAILQLVEEEKVDLDTHIGEYLGWELRHPVYPQANITLRMILSHVGSIKDDSMLLASLIVNGDATEDLDGFVSSYLGTGGSLYSPTNFDTERPGKVYSYSTVGLALAALVVQEIEGVPFSIWCETELFAKLGFASDGWFLDNLNASEIAIPHIKVAGTPTAQLPYGYPAFNAGLLRTNLRASTKMWRALMNEGAFGGQRVYSEAQNDILEMVHFPFTDPQQAFGWRIADLGGSGTFFSGGDDIGYSTVAYFDPVSNIGVIVLANITGESEELATLAQIALATAQSL